MADNKLKTTSSISSNTQQVSTARPNSREAELMTKLAENISDSYRMVKNRQQKFYDLTNQMKAQDQNSTAAGRLRGPQISSSEEEWQEVYSPKNKLKRKKTLSASLTSVTDSVNQEKRTRIEGIQLNCRGKLNLKENQNSNLENHHRQQPQQQQQRSVNKVEKPDKLPGKPPLPPKVSSSNESTPNAKAPGVAAAPPPPRLKRKLQENVQTIQKLNALAEQLRLEINELKSNLTTERGAVRVLRAQNEAETRKWKAEVKKLQNVVEHLKKTGSPKKSETSSTNTNADNLPQAAVGGLVNYEIQRLTNEINALKEANKALEEKKVLEEIKTKERNIGQLKKDLQTLQNSKSFTSRNATTNKSNTSTNKTTTLSLDKKPKINTNNNNNHNNNNATISNNDIKSNKQMLPPSGVCCNCKTQLQQPQQPPQTEIPQTTSSSNNDVASIIPTPPEKNECNVETKEKETQTEVENSDEISKLKNIELINNTKNVTTTNLQRSTTKILTSRDNSSDVETISTSLKSIHQQLKALDIPEVQHHNNCMNLINENGQFRTLLTTTTNTTNNIINCNSSSSASSASNQNAKLLTTNNKEEELITDHLEEEQELTQHLNNKAIEEEDMGKQTDLHHNHHSHSDSDSALSSAPPSISPQPPANGVEPTDIWQTIRSYSNDIEKLQKEVDSLHKENDKLRQELNMAKDQIIDLENVALEHNASNEKHQQLLERIKCLEDIESDLREQNELLEFRILELEDNAGDKEWSLQGTTNATTNVPQGHQNVWSCPTSGGPAKTDPFEMLFGSNSHTSTTSNSAQLDSGIISPQSQSHHEDLIDINNDELCRRLGDLLKKTTLDDEEKHCLQQVLNLVQQLDALTPSSGPSSLLANSSSEETSSMEGLVKTRISEFSSTTSSPLSSIRSNSDKSSSSSAIKSSSTNPATPRIVATVQPYNSQQIVPHNTPTDSPRKVRAQHQYNNSLSESGVFVESDFLTESGENTVCTQTDFEDSSYGSAFNNSLSTPTKNVPAHLSHQHIHQLQHPPSPNLSDQKRLQYYKERLEALEGKVQIYESSGDVQAKRLAERLQREILLAKEVKELRDRVEFLENENCTLEEEKCEFEEAENDTRLRLQRLEIELEILSQRNVELEMSREALSAKYKDCHSECMILRDDIATSETHIRHLEEDKQKAKENFEFLHNILPVLLVYNTACTLAQAQEQIPPPHLEQGTPTKTKEMGNQITATSTDRRSPCAEVMQREEARSSESCQCHEREIHYLKEEIKCLRHQIKELNSRHYAAMESADSHWVDLEREYKEREEQFRSKELSLKQKIQKLQDCLREDARSANEKICQLEETEQGLKTCLVKVSKEHQKLVEEHKCLVSEFERLKEQHDQLKEQQKPLTEALDVEKKRNKGLMDELTFMRKLQHETENQTKTELDIMRNQIFDLKKEYLHIEVTNGELREEVATLELQVDTLQNAHRDCEEKVRCLTDEIRTKDEICQKLEKRLERSEGYSLADELGDTPSKRFKREDIKDLQTASKGLGNALRHMTECEKMLPTQKQFQTVARDVKKLADTLLHGDLKDDEEVSDEEHIYEEQKEPCIEETKADIKNEEIRQNENGSGKSVPSLNESFIRSPLATSTPMKLTQSLEEVLSGRDQSEDELRIESKLKSEEMGVTVGMALMPQFVIREKLEPSCSKEMKQTICEVPSELRKLSKKPEGETNSGQTRVKSKKNLNFLKSLLRRRRQRSLPNRIRRILSKMQSRKFHNVSSLDICDSEVLQRNVSYSSFRSLHDETTDAGSDCKSVDVAIECRIKLEMVDKSTEILVEKCDCSVQVNEDLEQFPIHVRQFLNKITTPLVNAKKAISECKRNLYAHWKQDLNFREDLALLLSFSNSQNNRDVATGSYEGFVKIMSCLHILQDILSPHLNSVFYEIENQINEHLMSFHTKNMESQFYCTVYYPVKRPNSLEISQIVVKEEII
ncbi:PFTAIRE-interacting factor 1A isoform X2 [Musca autumnalis]|uniref:PFTAIRE-interacting factor 1A isoform X2 n=1 Tax=Musca autumnalis TaxID=221902 RepID=UPI003CEC3DE8